LGVCDINHCLNSEADLPMTTRDSCITSMNVTLQLPIKYHPQTILSGNS